MPVAEILSIAVGVAAGVAAIETTTVADKNAWDVEPTSMHTYSAWLVQRRVRARHV